MRHGAVMGEGADRNIIAQRWADLADGDEEPLLQAGEATGVASAHRKGRKRTEAIGHAISDDGEPPLLLAGQPRRDYLDKVAANSRLLAEIRAAVAEAAEPTAPPKQSRPTRPRKPDKSEHVKTMLREGWDPGTTCSWDEFIRELESRCNGHQKPQGKTKGFSLPNIKLLVHKARAEDLD
ncbi:MAG: hypothetical protein ACJ8AH_22115 [Stellaceae bacterium]